MSFQWLVIEVPSKSTKSRSSQVIPSYLKAVCDLKQQLVFTVICQ